MASWTGEEVAEGIELWLRFRRYEAATAGDSAAAEVIDGLLDEARESFVQGWMPWANIIVRD